MLLKTIYLYNKLTSCKHQFHTVQTFYYLNKTLFLQLS